MTVVSLIDRAQGADAEVVDFLREVLRMAEAGEVAGVTVIVEGSCDMGHGFAGRVCTAAMLGNVTLAQMRLRDMIEHGVEPELMHPDDK